MSDGVVNDRWLELRMVPNRVVDSSLRASGFGLSAVRCPVDVWQGDRDALVPAQWAGSLTADIPGAHLHSVAEEGHFLAHRRWDDVPAPFAG